MVDLKKVTLPPPPPNCTKCQIFKILDQKKKKKCPLTPPPPPPLIQRLAETLRFFWDSKKKKKCTLTPPPPPPPTYPAAGWVVTKFWDRFENPPLEKILRTPLHGTTSKENKYFIMVIFSGFEFVCSLRLNNPLLLGNKYWGSYHFSSILLYRLQGPIPRNRHKSNFLTTPLKHMLIL